VYFFLYKLRKFFLSNDNFLLAPKIKMSRKLVLEDDHDGSDDSDTEPSPKRQRTAKTRGIDKQAKLQERMTRQDLQIQAFNSGVEEQDEPPSLDDIMRNYYYY
jgi:hypothetical protein